MHIINTQCCISSNRRKGYARLCRDDIQPIGLMISTTLRAVMIYQTCGLDKKSRILLIRLFWRRRRDLNPCYSFPYYSLSRGAPWATWVLLHPINEYITFYYSCQLIMWKFFILVGFYLFLNSFVVFAPSAKYLIQSAILNITLVIMMFQSLLLRWKRFFQYGRNKK